VKEPFRTYLPSTSEVLIQMRSILPRGQEPSYVGSRNCQFPDQNLKLLRTVLGLSPMRVQFAVVICVCTGLRSASVCLDLRAYPQSLSNDFNWPSPEWLAVFWGSKWGLTISAEHRPLFKRYKGDHLEFLLLPNFYRHEPVQDHFIPAWDEHWRHPRHPRSISPLSSR
jgi:hypothetical protein